MKRVGYGNGKRRMPTMAFEIKYHPDNSTILKRLLCRVSASDDELLNNDNIHFVAYDLPEYTSSELYRTQILKQNNFLHNISVIPIVNIDPDVIYNELHYKLLVSPDITGIKNIHLTHFKRK